VAVNHISADVKVPYTILKHLDNLYADLDGYVIPPLVVNYGVALAFYESQSALEMNSKEIQAPSRDVPSATRAILSQMNTSTQDRLVGRNRGVVTRSDVDRLMAAWKQEYKQQDDKFSANDCLMSVLGGGLTVARYHMTMNLRALAPRGIAQPDLFGYQGVFLDGVVEGPLHPHIIRANTMAYLKRTRRPNLSYDNIFSKALGMVSGGSVFLNNWQSAQYWPKHLGKVRKQFRRPLDVIPGGDPLFAKSPLNSIFVMDRTQPDSTAEAHEMYYAVKKPIAFVPLRE
jgi:hypothetical protein